jgi:hypothetical protein
MPEMKVVLFKSTRIRVDDDGCVCLNDIHKAAGFSKNQMPADWQRLPSASREISSVLKRVTGKSRDWTKEEIKSVIYSVRGQDAGTWAHENIALGYAAYLSPDLAVEIRDVFLRYKRGDETLVSEIRDNREHREDAARDQVRAMGKQVRRGLTDTLKERGISRGWQYAQITDVTNQELLGGTAKKLRIERGLPEKANVRDHMSIHELAYTAASESLATERIEDQDARGYSACRVETSVAAQSIKTAIDSDRKNRQKKLPL